MATPFPITPGRAAPIPGATPFHPLVVERRPTSFADALAQYGRAMAAAREVERAMHGRSLPAAAKLEGSFGRRVDEAVEAADAALRLPARTISDLADKLRLLLADGDWEEHAAFLIADADRLARRA